MNKVKVFKDNAGEFRWTLVASNGEKIATSGEGYQRKSYAIARARELHPGTELEIVPDETSE